MSKTPINLAVSIVERSIEEMLISVDPQCQRVFAEQELLSELTAYVLNQVPNCYFAINNVTDLGTCKLLQTHYESEYGERVKLYIRVGIYTMFHCRKVSTKKNIPHVVPIN